MNFASIIKALNDNPGVIALLGLLLTLAIFLKTTYDRRRSMRPRLKIKMADSRIINDNIKDVVLRVKNAGRASCRIVNVSLNNYNLKSIPGNLLITPGKDADVGPMSLEDFYNEVKDLDEIVITLEYANPEDIDTKYSISHKYRWAKDKSFFHDLGKISET